ncbi:PREDICTED: zinc finger protein 436-like [Nanorana parkeri]|uniref:zinc finger protein 436-like n=1 Tax=Nanorana parkeri TaxID=125878 RepID=UPI000854CD6C|nr:PREDICTED: zinc finger protein 436-like [Nanorana parkeri]
MTELLTGEDQVDGTRGHRYLYMDVGMEDHQTLPAPDASARGKAAEEESARRTGEDLPEDSISSEEGIFTDRENDAPRDCARHTCPLVTGDSTSCDGESIRQEDISPPTLHKQTGQVRSEVLPHTDPLRPADHTQVTSGLGKVEASSYKDLDNGSSMDRRPHAVTRIKEEPLSEDEEHVSEADMLAPMECSQRTRVKDEPVSWCEGDCEHAGLYTHHGRSILAHVKAESSSGMGTPRRWPCLECGKTLSSRSNLFVHQRSHARKKPFTCAECGKGFSSRGYLVIHRRNHTGERPFACSECRESYAARSQLLRHQTKLHVVTMTSGDWLL